MRNFPSPLDGFRSPFGSSGGASLPSINSEGEVVTYLSDLSGTPDIANPIETVTFTDPGYTTAGAATTVNRTVYVGKRKRLPVPDENTLTAREAWLTDFAFTSTSVTALMNNSTLEYPPPTGVWLAAHLEPIYTSSHTIDLFIDHAYGRNGSPVARVTWSATDGTNTVTGVCTFTTKTYSASSKTVPVYRIVVPHDTGLSTGLITVDVTIYPHVASLPYSTPTDFSTYGGPNFSSFKYYNRNGGAPLYAAVSISGDGGNIPTAGNDGTGVTSTTLATAVAAPFATMAAAASALATANGSTLSECEIVFSAETHTYQDWDATQAVTSLAKLRGYSSAVAATTILTNPASELNSGTPRRAIFEHVAIQRANNNVMIGVAGATTEATVASTDTRIVLRNCSFPHTLSTGSSLGGFLRFAGNVYVENCTAVDLAYFRLWSATTPRYVNIVGSHGTRVIDTGCYNAIGCHVTGTGYFQQVATQTQWPAGEGQIIAYTWIGQSTGGTPSIRAVSPITARGFWVTHVLAEFAQVATSPMVSINADSNQSLTEWVHMFRTTIVGARLNAVYADAGTTRVKKRMTEFGCLFKGSNHKTDTDGAGDPNRTGNWGPRNGVRMGYGLTEGTDTNSAPSVPSPTSQLADTTYLGYVIGLAASVKDPNYVSDLSGGGGGGGDYHINSVGSTDAPTLPLEYERFPIFMDGASLALDGTDYAGAFGVT